MSRLLERSVEDRLAEAEFEMRRAKVFLKERDQISKRDPSQENLEQSRAAFLALREAEELFVWMQNEISNRRRQR